MMIIFFKVCSLLANIKYFSQLPSCFNDDGEEKNQNKKGYFPQITNTKENVDAKDDDDVGEVEEEE